MNLGLKWTCNTISLVNYACISSGVRTLQLSQRIFGEGQKVTLVITVKLKQFLETDIMTEWANAEGRPALWNNARGVHDEMIARSGNKKKSQDSLQPDYTVINLTLYYTSLQKLWGTNLKRKVLNPPGIGL